MNNFGCFLQDQKKYIEAETIYREALHIREKVCGPKHLDTVISLNNVGGILRDLGNPHAELYFRRALCILRNVYPSNESKINFVENNLNIFLNGPLSKRELLWKQPDFITATGYAKAFTELSGQTTLSFVSLLLGANIANSNEQLEKPIEALTKGKSIIQEAAIKLGISSDKKITPILDRSIPMNEELKSTLQEYRKSTLECLVDALIDRVI